MHRTWSIASIPVAFVVLFAAAPLAAASSPARPTAQAAPASAGIQWAYGANYSNTATWTNSSGGYTASLTVFFGWQTILTQTTGANGSLTLEANRTMALDYWLSFCKPTCTSASISGNVSVRAWQRQEGFANLTTNGVVTVNGTVVPALALLNVTDRTQGNVTESVYEAVHGLLNTRTTEYYFSVNASSAVSVAFAPALGIVPNTLSPGLVWNSTSTFDATGTWSAEYSYHHLPLTGTPIEFHGPISGQVTKTGTVSLYGTDLGPVVLNGGLATDAAAITIDGPFHFYEGFLLVPGNTDVAGGSSGSAWSSYQNDSAEAATGALNIGAHTSHVGLLASSSSYAPQSSSPSTVGAVVGSSPATTGSVAPRFAPMSAGPSGGGVLQAQPESVGAAEQNSTCLVGGSCVSPLGHAPGRALPGLLGVLVIGLLVGTIVVMAVVVERRRSTPPPVHPNAQLYPTVSVPAAGSRAPPRPEESSDDDPLGHLW